MAVDNLQPGEEPAYARFRFDGNDVFFSSVGGASQTLMTFEFAVPSGYRPIGLYIKGSRWEVPAGAPPKNLAEPAERDAEIVARGGVYPAPNAAVAAVEPIVASNALGFTIQSGSEQSLEIHSEGGKNWIRNGEQAYSKQNGGVGGNRGLERALQINRFEVSADTVLVKVDVSPNSPASILSEAAIAADPSQALLLMDTNGTAYRPVGYVYQDTEKFKVRYTVGREIASLQELSQAGVALSTSRSDQKLELIFRVTYGQRVASFQIGGTVVYQVDPPLQLDQRQQ
jgi:hypothetical protein